MLKTFKVHYVLSNSNYLIEINLCSNRRGCFKNLSSKSFIKNTCEGGDFFLSCRLGIYSFTKNEIIHRCSSKILVAPFFGSFTDSHFQVGSFVKHLLWHQITLQWTASLIFRSTPYYALPTR